MRRFLPLTGAALLAGCIFTGDDARERYLAEVARDLGPPDDAPSRARGEALVRQADEASGREALSLADCFRLALARSESLRQHGERLLQSDALEYEAIAGLLPRVVAHGRYTEDSDLVAFGGSSFSPRERTEYWVTVTETLFDGRLLEAWDLAAETRAIEALSLRDERDRLIFEVASSFYEVLGREADLRAIEAARSGAAEHLRVLDAHFRAGEAVEPDVLLARARRDEMDARAEEALRNIERSRARLARLVGISPLPGALEDTFEVTEAPGEIPRLVDRALAERIDLARARAEVERAETERDMALSSYLPRASFQFDQWTHMEGGFNRLLDWTLTISIDWTALDGGAREAELARTLSTVRERELQVEALERDVRLDVEDAVLAFRALDGSLAAFESRAAAAREASELAILRLRAGEATSLDVLVAQEAGEAAERDLYRTRFARKLAALRIRLAVGDLHAALAEPPR